MALEIMSDAFADGEDVPVRHTCDGEDVSPPLSIEGMPAEAESLALVVDDPDAPGTTWVHWVLYGLDADVGSIPEGVPPEAEVLGGARQGENDFGDLGWGGPCPPPGEDHRYVFKLYALEESPDLSPGATKGELLGATETSVLEEGRLVGRYQRS